MNLHNPVNPNAPGEQPVEFADLERELRQALRPVNPAAGFADRVLARSREPKAAPNPARVLMFPVVRSRAWTGGAIAAMLLVGVAGEQAHERVDQRRKAEEAQKQFETALQITDRALDHAREQLQRAGVPFGQQ